MCTTKVSPTLATMFPLASINMPELSMATCPRGSVSTAEISPADAATARCTSSRSGMCRLSHPAQRASALRARRADAVAGQRARHPVIGELGQVRPQLPGVQALDRVGRRVVPAQLIRGTEPRHHRRVHQACENQ